MNSLWNGAGLFNKNEDIIIKIFIIREDPTIKNIILILKPIWISQTGFNFG